MCIRDRVGLGVGMGQALLSPRLAGTCVDDSCFSAPNRFARRMGLGRSLKSTRPHLVHAQFGHLALDFLPVIAARNIPLVVSFRGQDMLLVSRTRARSRDALFDYASRVLARSHDMRNELLCLRCPADKVFVHPSGIDVPRIPFHERRSPPAGRDVLLLMAGRLVKKKGMADALRAMAVCRPAGQGLQLRIAGDGPERSRLEHLVEELGLHERVRFLGALSHNALIQEMASAHLFILPCRRAADGESEGVPNVLKEAQATGLPVLSTRHAGIPECVVHEETGTLVPEGDSDALGQGLDDLLTHADLWPDMGRKGRARMAEHYDLQTLALKLIAHYHAVLG